MLKSVIADSNKHTREQLESILAQLDIQVSGSFASGAELINYIEENRVDIVFVSVDSLWLDIAKLCSEKFNYISVILLGDSKDFQTAQKAMGYGVRGYILKPFSHHNIADALSPVIAKSDSLGGNDFSSAFMKKTRFQKLFSDIYGGLYQSNEDILSALQAQSLFDSDGYKLDFKINAFENYMKTQWHYGSARFFNALSTIAYLEVSGGLFCLFIEDDANFSIIAINADEASVENYISHLLNTIDDMLQTKAEFVSKTYFPSITALPEMYSAHSSNPATRIDRINTYINENYMYEFSLDSMANHFGFSKEYFCALYKRLSGKTLTQAIQDIRLNKACAMLTGSDLKISQIASHVGYKSQPYFIDIFKSRYGLSPSEYRKLHANSNPQNNRKI